MAQEKFSMGLKNCYIPSIHFPNWLYLILILSEGHSIGLGLGLLMKKKSTFYH